MKQSTLAAAAAKVMDQVHTRAWELWKRKVAEP